MALHARNKNSWTLPLVAVLVGQLVFAGCVHIRHDADYASDVRQEPLPLRATVAVLVAPELRKEMDDEEERVILERVRGSFQRALVRDLGQNGPLQPVAERPEARLVVTIEKLDFKMHRLWIMMWFLAPLWLFGVPMHKMRTNLAVEAVLTSWKGQTLFRLEDHAECTRHQGIYYGHRDLTFGCPARRIGERLREQISLDRARILARVERRPSAPATTPPAAPGTRPVAVVFRIRDMSGKLDERVLAQLNEYLSTQVAQQLDFKVVPPEQLRERLLAVKKESHKMCYERSCQIELGRALAANKTVSTTLIRVGRRCVFNATVIDLKTEAADRAASAETRCDDEALLDGITRVIRALRPAP